MKNLVRLKIFEIMLYKVEKNFLASVALQNIIFMKVGHSGNLTRYWIGAVTREKASKTTIFFVKEFFSSGNTEVERKIIIKLKFKSRKTI